MSDEIPLYERRPGVISFIAFVLFAQAFMALVGAISLTVWRGAVLDYLEEQGSPISGATLTGTVIGELIAALVLGWVAVGLMRGYNEMRLFVAIVQCLHMAFAVYVLVVHHAGGYQYRAVFALFVGVFVLWALYGNDASDAYFRAEP